MKALSLAWMDSGTGDRGSDCTFPWIVHESFCSDETSRKIMIIAAAAMVDL